MLQSKQQKVVQEDKVSKIGQFSTLTCSHVYPDSASTMPENQGTTNFCYQNEVNFEPKFLQGYGIFEIRGGKSNRL